MSVDRVRDAYSARAAEYTAKLGSIDAVAMEDRDLVLAWARQLSGQILDVGCGPGHWTNYLWWAGVQVEGVDPVGCFIDGAQRRYPTVPFRRGHAEDLAVDGGSLGGVLAWYSLIHTDPDRIDMLLDEFARAVAPDGGLLMGFFEGPAVESFEHAVVTAYRWPIDELARRVTDAGFRVTSRQKRAGEGTRPHGALVATRRHI